MTGGPPTPPADGRILVVDGDRGYLDFMRLLLTGEGFIVDTVTSLEEADRALCGHIPDVVICDVHLPHAAPFAVLERLTARPETATLPVIVCTGGLTDGREASRRFTSHNLQVVTKPFDIDDLIEYVRRAVTH